MADAAAATAMPYLPQLMEVLTKFGSVQTTDIFAEHYDYHPAGNKELALVGEGSYGKVYRARSRAAPKDPVRVIKEIPLARITKNSTQVSHVVCELVVTGAIKHPHINRRVGLFHSDVNFYIVLEMCGGPRPDVLTRIAHIIAYRKPHRLTEVEALYARWRDGALRAGIQDPDGAGQEAFGDWVDEQGLIRGLAAECGVNLARDSAELPVSGDLFGFIVAYRRLADPFNQIVTRQLLLAVEHLHQAMIVHRDIKTENVVLAVKRKALLVRDEQTGQVSGVKFYEKIEIKLIDFGLVKFMLVQDTSTSPGGYARAIDEAQRIKQEAEKQKKAEEESKQKQQDAAAKKAQKKDNAADEDEEEDDDDDDEPAKPAWSVDKLAPLKAPAQAGAADAFLVASTACGTEIYASRELLTALVETTARTSGGRGGSNKWTSSSLTLPKVDTFGVACCSYCCSAGKPPFRPPETYRRISREERLKQIERLVAAGPIFPNYSSEPAKDFVRKLMDNDVDRRPSASEALQEPFVNHNCDSLLTVIHVAGSASIQMISVVPEGFAPFPADGAAPAASADDAVKTQPQQQQQQQGNNNDVQQDGASQPRDDSNGAAAAAAAVASSVVSIISSEGNKDGAADNDGGDGGKKGGGAVDGDGDNTMSKSGEHDAEAELMEAMRHKEDGGDSAGKPAAAGRAAENGGSNEPEGKKSLGSN